MSKVRLDTLRTGVSFMRNEGKSGPLRGGVNCESRDSRVKEMRSIGIWFLRRKNASSIYVEHSCRLERSP